MSFYSSDKMSTFKDNEQLYLDEIQKIKSSFRVCLSKNQFQDLINHRQYEDAFYGIQPVRKEIIDKITNPGFNSWLDYQTHVINLIIEKGGFYMDVSLEKIDFKKSDTSIRSMAEISEIELMQGIKAFVYSFEYFEEEELRSVISSLVGYDANDPEFSLRFDDVVETMLNNHLIQRIGDRLFLKLS